MDFSAELKIINISNSASKPVEDIINNFLEAIDSLKSVFIIDNFENIVDQNCKMFLSKAQSKLRQSNIVIVSNCLLSLDPFDLLDIYKIKLHLLTSVESHESCKSFLDRSGLDSLIDYDYIFQKLNGHPLFIKYFYSMICNGRSSLRELSQDNSKIDTFINTYIYKEIWSTLTDSQKEVLKVLSVLEVPIELSQLISILDENIEADVIVLLDRFLIEHLASGELYLHNYLKSYIKKSTPKVGRLLHFNIAKSFSKKETYFVKDLQQIYFHFLEGNYIPQFVATLLEITEFFLLSFIEMDELTLVIDKNLYVNQGEYFEELLEAKVKLLIAKSNIPEALSLKDQIKDQYKLNRINLFIAYHQGRYEETISLVESNKEAIADLSPLAHINLNLTISVSFFRQNQRSSSELYLKMCLVAFESNSFIKAAIYRYVFMGYLPLDLHLSIDYLKMAHDILQEEYPQSALYAAVLFDQSTVEFKYLNNYSLALTQIVKSKGIFKELKLGQKYIQASLVEAGILIRNLDTEAVTKIIQELREDLNIDPFTSVKIDMLHGGIYLLKHDIENTKMYMEKGFNEIERLGIASRQFHLMFLRYLVATSQFERAYEFSQRSTFTTWFQGYPEDEAEKYHYFIKIHRLLQMFDQIPDLQAKKD
ncbi:MAG: hypothetical protein KC646_04430 [Candidatus Cloacimonetes bacterium]|nr:hypothetical protein [Candidatus Cloacimonadota bacterium]